MNTVQDLQGAIEALRAQPDRRRHPRVPWNVVLTVFADLGGDPSVVMDVITLDVSLGGMGLLSERPLAEGVLIQTEFLLRPGGPEVRCSVGSCIGLGKWHRLGVSFVDTDLATR